MRRCLFTLSALLVLPACAGSADAPGGAAFRVDTVGGVPHAINEGTPPVWRLEAELTLGSAGGDEAIAFGRIVDVLLDGEGRIFVADQAADEIRVFAPDGTPLQTFGRPGSGPGEFRDIYGLAWLADTLAVMDPGNARIGLLTTEGSWLGQHDFPRITGNAAFVRVFQVGTEPAYVPAIVEEPETRAWRSLAAGADAPPLAVPQPAMSGSGVLCRGEEMLASYSNPTAPGILLVPAPGRSVFAARTEAYRVARLAAGGDTLRVMERSLEARPVADTTNARIQAAYEAWRENLGQVTCQPNHLAAFDQHPLIRALTSDDLGRTWVEADGATGRSWDVFDAEGRLLGSAPAPHRRDYPLPHIRGGRVAVVEEAPEGYHRVVVYRLVEGG